MTLPIQKPGAPDTLLRMRFAPPGDARHAQGAPHSSRRRSSSPIPQDGERARIAVDRHTERLRHAIGSDVTVRRPDPAANHPPLLEIDAERRQIFRDIADVLVFGAASDYQERGRDNLFWKRTGWRLA